MLIVLGNEWVNEQNKYTIEPYAIIAWFEVGEIIIISYGGESGQHVHHTLNLIKRVTCQMYPVLWTLF